MIDGWTFSTVSGVQVHVAQISVPLGAQCFTKESERALARLLPPGTVVDLRPEPHLDAVDRGGRLVRYVFVDSQNVSLAMVKQGAAAPYFLDGVEGRYASALMKAAKAAKKSNLGLWGTCRGYTLYPFARLGAARTGRKSA